MSALQVHWEATAQGGHFLYPFHGRKFFHSHGTENFPSNLPFEEM